MAVIKSKNANKYSISAFSVNKMLAEYKRVDDSILNDNS